MTATLPADRSCCMCGIRGKLYLQYKVGTRPWMDAVSEKQEDRSITHKFSKLATCLRWLCEQHWNEDKGRFNLSKIEKQLANFWNFHEKQSRVKTNPKRLLD